MVASTGIMVVDGIISGVPVKEKQYMTHEHKRRKELRVLFCNKLLLPEVMSL